MREYQSLSHTKWNCKYHIVFIPKRRKKAIFGKLRKHLGQLFHELAKQKDCKIEEGHLMPDHVHMCISIPPKYAVSNVVGFIKGKSAISIARQFMGKTKNFTRENFWARGYFVSTVGLDEEIVKAYIREQEAGSRYFCESFYGHPCPTSGKNYATANAFGGPSRPASFAGHPTRGAQHHSRNDSTRCRKACIFTTQKALRENTCAIASGGLLDSCLAAADPGRQVSTQSDRQEDGSQKPVVTKLMQQAA